MTVVVPFAKASDKYLNQVREQQKNIPVCTLDDLSAADGVLIGSPTRYGNMTAQMKQLVDSTASLWLKGEMEGKPAGVFTCTASTHGGQETTLVTMMIPLLHLGMLIVGVPVLSRGDAPHGSTRGHTVWRNDNCRRTRRVAANTGGPRHCSGTGAASGRDHSQSAWLISFARHRWDVSANRTTSQRPLRFSHPRTRLGSPERS